MFECRALGAIEVKGLPHRWRRGRCAARRPASAASRRGARARCPRSSAGRRRSSCCCAAGSTPRRGEGRVVLLSGEPGIGKSRIAESLLARLEGEPHMRLRYFCSPHHTHSALYPFIAQLERAASFEPAVTPEQSSTSSRPCSSRRREMCHAMWRSSPSCWGCRRTNATRRWRSARSRSESDARSAARPARRRGGAEARADRVRGRPLDRSDIAGAARSNRGPRREPAGAAGCHVPPRVPAPLDRPAACDDAALEPPWPPRQRRHHW